LLLMRNGGDGTEIESCKDCANFEDRRDIEGVALCAMHHGPSICCQEFQPRSAKVDPDNLSERFCVNCSSYEEVYGIAICAKDHRPQIACSAFQRKNKGKTRKEQTIAPLT